jgi:hypothetical protein
MQEMGRRGRSGPTRYPETRTWGPGHPWRLHPELIPRGPRPGNYAAGDNHWTRRMPERISHRGTSHTSARLTPEIVREIRERSGDGEGATSIARGLDIGRTTVRAVIEGRTWAHVA